jgi:hypothetical protein
MKIDEEERKKVLLDWNIANTFKIYKGKLKRDKPGNYGEISLSSVRDGVPRIFWNPGW